MICKVLLLHPSFEKSLNIFQFPTSSTQPQHFHPGTVSFADMLGVCSAGKEGEETTFEERSHTGGQPGLNGGLSGGNPNGGNFSGGNPNGGPSAISVQSISGTNFIPAADLQAIQKASLRNGLITFYQTYIIVIIMILILIRRQLFWQWSLGGRRQR